MPEQKPIVDYLNDELLRTPEEKRKAIRTPTVDRAIEVLERINAFVEESGQAPVSLPGRDVRERMLANKLAGLQASSADLQDLQGLDTHRLLSASQSGSDPMDDPLLSDGVGIFEVREELKPIARPDYVADRQPCGDFARFEPLFEQIRQGVEDGSRNPQPFRQERVDLSEFFVLKGQLVHVADVREEPRPTGRADARLRVIFDNGTESNLLMSSLVRRLYEDKDARRIGIAEAGPLFEGARTGLVCVLRSLSQREEVSGLLKVGTTAGTVEDRIARAETQSTFLFAPVEIVETRELIGHSAKEAETRVHRVLRPYQVSLRVTGPDGRTFNATEWFKVSQSFVDASLDRVLGRP